MLQLVMEKNPTCRIDNCGNVIKIKSRQLCSKHYSAWQRHGDPKKRVYANKGAAKKFCDNALETKTDKCINHPKIVTNGYGYVNWNGKQMYASRYICWKRHGPPPSSLHEAAHKPEVCHNRACCNPKHIEWKLPSENAADRRIDKTETIGERHGQSKLKLVDVLSIRQDTRPQSKIAASFNVSRSTINDIKNHYTWKWLD